MSHSQPAFILALLLLNAPATQAASIVRTVQVKANGNTETQSASLNSLASMMPDHPEAQELTSSLLMLAQGKPSDELLAMVKDLKSQIEPWHSNATATLNKAVEAIKACTAGMEGNMEQQETKKNVCTTKSSSHTTHRTEEGTKFTTKEHWKAETAEKTEVMETECKIFNDVKLEVRSATASYGGGDEETYVEGVAQEFCENLKPRYNEAKEKCTTAKADHAKVSETYKTATTAHTSQKTASDTVQTGMDTACCEHALATKAACKSYGTCYEDQVAKYNSLKAIIESEEKVKKTEWRVYSRIECLLPVLGTDNKDGIEKCRAKTHSTSHLDIEYPAIPEKSTCNVEKAFPGTEEYYNTHFGTLPGNAKGKNVAICTGMGSEGTMHIASAAGSTYMETTGDCRYPEGGHGNYGTGNGDLASCKAQCDADPQCDAFDASESITTSSTTCWWFHNTGGKSHTGDGNGGSKCFIKD